MYDTSYSYNLSLVSIRKPHTDNILDHRKRVEWRKHPMPTGRQICYESKSGGGCGKVIGEYTVYQIRRYERVSDIPQSMIDAGYVSKKFLQEYSGGKPLYAHKIIRPKRYETPKELSEFGLKRPPQSWCYIKELSDG